MKKIIFILNIIIYSNAFALNQVTNEVYNLSDKYLNHEINKIKFQNEIVLLSKNEIFSTEATHYLAALERQEKLNFMSLLRLSEDNVENKQIPSPSWYQENKKWIWPVAIIGVIAATTISQYYDLKISF